MSKARDIANLLTDGKVEADDLNVGQLGGRRNLIINGGFDVWQRGTSQTTTGYGSVDRFSFDSASMSSVNKGSDIANGFKNVLEVTLKETTNWQYPTRYSLEANTLVAGKTYTLSYYGKASQNVTGMYGHFQTSTAGQVKTGLSTEFTTEWVKYSHTFTIPSSYGGEQFDMYLLNHNRTGLGGVTFYLAEIQIELGSVATPFEHRSYGEELALCQRYYWAMNAGGHPSANATSYARFNGVSNGSYNYFTVEYPCQMRTTPTLIKNNISSSTVQVYDYGNNAYRTLSSMGNDESSQTNMCVWINTSDVSMSGSGMMFRWLGAPNASIGFDAEL